MDLNKRIKCPKCGSVNVYIGKRGFATGRAIAGGLLTGNIFVAAAAGGIGANKIIITCLECGHEFRIGEGEIEKHYPSRAEIAAFERHVIPKEEMPKVGTFLCDCGKMFNGEIGHAYCPKCGRRMTEKNIPTTAEYKKMKGGGCLSVCFISIITTVSLLIIKLCI